MPESKVAALCVLVVVSLGFVGEAVRCYSRTLLDDARAPRSVGPVVTFPASAWARPGGPYGPEPTTTVASAHP